MPLIPKKNIEYDGTHNDVFAYFRKYYSSSNLSKDGYVSLIPSSTYWGDEYSRTDASNLISEPDDKRWCSRFDENPSLIIKFHSNFVTLFSYTIESITNARHIRSWAIYGFSRGQKYLLDKKINQTIFDEGELPSIFGTFNCTTVGTFTKFSIESAGPDSKGDNLLSMASIQFYGFVNQFDHTIHISLETCPIQTFLLQILLVCS